MHLANVYGRDKEMERVEGNLKQGTRETVIPVSANLQQDKLIEAVCPKM